MTDLNHLPITGVGEELDRYFSSIFIDPLELGPEGELYGTRSQTVIAVWEDGRVEVRERYVEEGADGSWPWSEVKVEAQLVVEGLDVMRSNGEQQEGKQQQQGGKQQQMHQHQQQQEWGAEHTKGQEHTRQHQCEKQGVCRVAGHEGAPDAGGGICNGSGGGHGVSEGPAAAAAAAQKAAGIATAAAAEEAGGGGEGVQQARKLPPAVVAAFKGSVA